MSETSTITVNRTELGNAVAFASLGLAKRPAVPVLGGMRVAVSCGTLELAAFDYETTARAKVSGQASGPGVILVDGRDLTAAVKALPKGKSITATVTIADTMVITCDGTETVLSAMPIDEYPSMPAMPASSGLADAFAFVTSVNRVAPIASTDDTLPILTHVHLTSDHGEITLEATDRYRLAIDHLGWTGADGAEVLIPAAILARFAKAADRSGKITLAIGDTHAGLSDGIRTVIMRSYPLNDHGRTYVDTRHLIRADHDTVATADAGKLRTALERAAKLTGRNDRTGFDVTDGQITVTAVANGQPIGTQHVPAEVTGPDYLTGFNAGYVASILAGFGGTVRIGFKATTTTDPFSRTVRTSQGPAQLTADGETFLALCMPIAKKD